MFIKSTRRAFLSNTAMAMAASKLPVDLYPEHATDNSLPPRQTNFDDDWKFSKGDVQGAHLTYFSDENWSTVILPHDWSIEGPFNKDTVGGETCAYLRRASDGIASNLPRRPPQPGKRHSFSLTVYINAVKFGSTLIPWECVPTAM
jgi:hypothetical protein